MADDVQVLASEIGFHIGLEIPSDVGLDKAWLRVLQQRNDGVVVHDELDGLRHQGSPLVLVRLILSLSNELLGQSVAVYVGETLRD